MKNIIITLTIILTLLSVSAFAVGTTSGEVLTILSGSSGPGCAGIFAPVKFADSVTYNPAAASFQKGLTASALYRPWLFNSSLFNIAGTYNLGSAGTVGLTVGGLSYGTLTEYKKPSSTTGVAEKVGDSSTMDMVVGAVYGRQLNSEIGIGLSLNSIMLEQNSAFSASVGGIYKSDTGMGAGFALRNLGSKVGDASLPMNINIDGNYSIDMNGNTLMPMLDIGYLMEGDAEVSLALQFVYQDMLYANVGYKAVGPVTGVRAGIGVVYNTLIFAYGLEPMSDAEQLTHSIRLGINMNISGSDTARAKDAAENAVKTAQQESTTPSVPIVPAPPQVTSQQEYLDQVNNALGKCDIKTAVTIMGKMDTTKAEYKKAYDAYNAAVKNCSK